MYEFMQVNSMTGSRQSNPEVVDSGPETVKTKRLVTYRQKQV